MYSHLGEGHLLDGDGGGGDLGELMLYIGSDEGEVPLLKEQAKRLLQDLGCGRNTVTSTQRIFIIVKDPDFLANL